MSNQTLFDHVTHVHRMDWSSRSVRNRKVKIITQKQNHSFCILRRQAAHSVRNNIWRHSAHRNKVWDISTAATTHHSAGSALNRKLISDFLLLNIYSEGGDAFPCRKEFNRQSLFSDAWLHKQHFLLPCFPETSLYTNQKTTQKHKHTWHYYLHTHTQMEVRVSLQESSALLNPDDTQ